MNLSILCFASLMGTWVDQASSRLATLSTTIVANRVSVIASCFLWLVIVEAVVGADDSAAHVTDSQDAFWLAMRRTTFAFITIFGIIERLSRTANLLSIERDWVPTLAFTPTGEVGKFGLTQLNAVMSRIDLVCKLFAPIAISSFASAVGSIRAVAIALLILNAATFPAEIATARMVWNSSIRLRDIKATDPKENSSVASVDVWSSPELNNNMTLVKRFTRQTFHIVCTGMLYIKIWLQDYRDNLHIYFTYRVWIPSMALSVLHFSVLNYSATLTVYLLSSGFSVSVITMAKAFSSVWEIGSTFFYPFGVQLCRRLYIKSAHVEYGSVVQEEDNTELLEDESSEAGNANGGDGVYGVGVDMGVATLGLFGLGQMFFSLVSCILAFSKSKLLTSS